MEDYDLVTQNYGEIPFDDISIHNLVVDYL